jgi:hypothetical protein
MRLSYTFTGIGNSSKARGEDAAWAHSAGFRGSIPLKKRGKFKPQGIFGVATKNGIGSRRSFDRREFSCREH